MMIEIGLIRDIVAIFGVIAGFSYYVLTVRATRRNQRQQLETRQAQLFTNIYRQINSNEAIHNEFEIMSIELESADDYHELLNDKTRYTAINWFMSYYEGMGVLVRRDLVDVGLVSEMMSGNIIWFWERYRDAFLDCRVKYNWPRWMIELEYLYDRVKEYMLEHHPDVGVESPTPTG